MSRAPDRRALLVLGMHRSGTSALARVLSLRGADLPAHLLQANRGNESGYWEPLPIVAFNDEMLDYFGTSWDDPFAPFQLPEPALFPRRFAQRARELLAQEFGDSSLFVLKDPRNCLLGAFWLQVLAADGIRACPVLLARPAAEICASLLARDQTLPEASALLALSYAVEAALLAGAGTRTVLRYDQLLSDWRGASDRIASDHGLHWPRSGAFLDAEVAGFLVRPSSPAPSLHPSPQVQDWLQSAWQWYHAASQGEVPDLAPLQAIREAMASASQSFAPLVASRRQRIRAVERVEVATRAELAQRQALLEQTAHERDELMAQRDQLLGLQQGEAERRAAYAELLVERDTLLGRYQAAREAGRERDRLQAQRDADEAELERLRSAVAAYRDEAERERASAGQLLAEAQALRGERDQLAALREREVAELRGERDHLAALREQDLGELGVAREAMGQAQAEAARQFEAAQALLAQAAELRAERDRLLGLHADDLAALAQSRAEAERERAAAADWTAQAAALRDERDRALSAFHGTDATLHATEQAFAELSTQAEDLRTQRESHLQSLAELGSRLESATAESAALRDLVVLSHAQEQALRSEAAGLSARLDQVRNERDDQRALAGQRELDLAQLRDRLDAAETARLALAADLQRAVRELDLTRSELRRAQDAMAQFQASRSWRITAPLRSVATAGRQLVHVTRNTLQRPKRILQLAPPEAARPPAADLAEVRTSEPPYARRKHAGLRAFLTAEFGDGAAADMLLRIDRYRLPVDTGAGRAAASIACSDDDARAWVVALARRAAQRPADDSAPDVSIVVPVFNQLPFTLACLDALIAHESRFRFEVLIGDDASTDGTPRAFAEPIAGVHYLRHAGNLGFVRNCNATARLARGRHVVMLNNDALVLPGWLDEMIGVLEANPGVGLVGSKLVYPDGRLQECGGIVWRDGSAWNFGRLDDPRKPEYNYLRGADFVSGASIALPAALWRKLGGFDELFVPAYAEDVDLAFRVRAAGLHTLVQPLSQVLHFEGISAGTDLGQGMKAHQVGNLVKLHQRWEQKLSFHRPNGELPEMEKERDSWRRLLFIDHCTLTPNEDAGSLVAFEIMTSFRRHGYKVTFIPEDNFAHMGEDTRVLQRLGVEAIYHPAYSRMEQFLAARDDAFDVVVLHRFTVGDRHLAVLREKYPGARFVFLACDLHYLREQREAELSGDALARKRAQQTRQRELAVMGGSDAVIVYSEAEQEIVRAELPQAQVSLFPLVHDPVADPAPLERREGVCFVGGYRHPPNADAIRWFVDQVWPLVHARCPQAVLHVAGSHMTDEVKALGTRPGVEITGFVPDMEAFLSRRRVNIAPLRFGAGVKGKVAASLANGLPTVGTHIAAEGMLLTPGEDILVADDPAGFAAHVVDLLNDDARWRDVSAAGLRYAATVTSRASAHARIGELLAQLGLPELA